MRMYSSILICLLVACYPCSAHLFGLRNFRLINTLRFQNGEMNNIQSYGSIETFNQNLDHFDPTNNITWEQRYAANPSFFKTGSSSPVFLMISGESEAYFQGLMFGAWIEYAKKYGAFCIMLEHRYYGGSQPTKDMSTENLKYLSSEQALADTAYFIEGMNKKYGLTKDNKWIAFGGSYAGSLAAWLRYKYPHLVHGAVSSSGPLLAKADFPEYLDVVKSSLDTYGQNCSSYVTEANKQIQELMKSDAGKEKIEELFWLCHKLDDSNEKDIENLYSMLNDGVIFAVQNNDVFIPLFRRNGIDIVCSKLTNHTDGELLARFAAVYKDMLMPQECINYKYSDHVKRTQDVAWDTRKMGRQWIYQTCTEFGFYQTSEKENSLFGPVIDLNFYEDFCTDVFGPSFNQQQVNSSVYRTNTIYGGLNIKATRVIYVHGSLDPWHALGITHSTNPEAPAIFINGTSHCANMNNGSPLDVPELKEARVKISALIGKWLNEK